MPKCSPGKRCSKVGCARRRQHSVVRGPSGWFRTTAALSAALFATLSGCPVTARAASDPPIARVNVEAAAVAANIEPRVYVNLGAAGILFDTSVKVEASGKTIPRGSATATNNPAFIFEIGYLLTKNFSVSFTAGFPPTTKLFGAGSLESKGQLGKVTYGPTALSLKYHYTGFGDFRPYVGIGAAYVIIFNTDDGSLQHLQASDGFGPLFVAGANLDLTKHTGLYFDFKKILTYSDAHFFIPEPAPGATGKARLHLNPTIIDLGVSFRF